MNVNNPAIKDWIDKADHYLGSARLIYLHNPEYFDTIAFHCQQAAEKYLKTILVYHDLEFRRSHNLTYLLDILSHKIEIEEELYDKAIFLNGFGIQIRYPGNLVKLSKDELETSIGFAEKFRAFATKTIGFKG